MQVDASVTSVAISSDGRLVAAGCLDNIVRLWDVQTGALIERLMGHKDSVYSITFAPDGVSLLSGSLDQTIKRWDLGPLLRHPRRSAPLKRLYEVPQGRREESEKGCKCTANYTGHKVRVC
jgi:glucose repression regulatory protein TUP1